ncbi:MAG TPA: hypothetical protein VMQ65_04265 [Candidatus Limnocylindria bacterium]|nr:hypothetical protein [Candidatus Limnocylindria bacterium]
MSQVNDPSRDEPVTETVRPVVKAKRGPNLINAVLGLAVLLAVGGVAFAGGRMTAPAAAAFPGGGPAGGGFPGGPGASPGAGGGGFQPGGAGQPGGGLFGAGGVTVEGTVESRSGDTLTVRTSDGQTVEITLPADTTFHAQGSATSDDVQSGTDVLVRVEFQPGQGTNQITADDVTIVP